jgi:hypothetical protein
MPTAAACKLGDFLLMLGVKEKEHAATWLRWPPDTFAVVASILKKSGAYTDLIHKGPPYKTVGPLGIRQIGKDWRLAAAKGTPIPAEVVTWWRQILASREVELGQDRLPQKTINALLSLCAAADQACAGVGVPGADGRIAGDQFEREAVLKLVETDTLCDRVSASRVRVLPKLHTPQSGITLRSLTHHLALCATGDVVPRWRIFPGGPEENRGLNLLLLPWPRNIVPNQFRSTKERLKGMPAQFGFFRFEPAIDPNQVLADVIAAFAEASRMVGTIDGIILPELSLDEHTHQILRQNLIKVFGRAFLICGVGGDPVSPGGLGSNFVQFDVPVDAGAVAIRQDKHHRWKLDRSQILQYGCGANLSHEREWWEAINVTRRQLAFVSMNPWLTMSVLICEDLARQDPVSELIRAIGPNLVIALLMDGPQLTSRWGARYATVLADDPGSSVLTLTSLGMAALSRPPGKPISRVVGLWKDAVRSEPVELSLPEDADGLVLTLSAEFREEFTADGRGDGRTTGFPVLAGVHPVIAKISRRSV